MVVAASQTASRSFAELEHRGPFLGGEFLGSGLFPFGEFGNGLSRSTHRLSADSGLIGDSGTGKSHLLIALGTEVLSGYRVKYTLATKLVNELVEAADDKRLVKTIARYGRVDLLCIDELGYMALDRSASKYPVEVRRTTWTECVARRRIYLVTSPPPPERQARSNQPRGIPVN